jgi:hypothetical protein
VSSGQAAGRDFFSRKILHRGFRSGYTFCEFALEHFSRLYMARMLDAGFPQENPLLTNSFDIDQSKFTVAVSSGPAAGRDFSQEKSLLEDSVPDTTSVNSLLEVEMLDQAIPQSAPAQTALALVDLRKSI